MGFPEAITGYKLPGPPSAPLTADDGGLFVTMGQRVTAYLHPDFALALELTKKDRDKKAAATGVDEKPPIELEKLKAELEKIKEDAEKKKGDERKDSSLQPVELWSYYTTATVIQQAPITTYEKVCVVTSAGNFLALNRFETFLSFEFKTQGDVSAPMGQYGLTAFVGSDDYCLYALNMHSDKITWRFVAQAPIYRKPEVTDSDIYVTADKIGMYRLIRETGEKVWVNARAEQFLAANPKFVYALDRQGFVLILDALRGTTLAAWDARDWTMHLANEWTDRMYLAAQDGQIIAVRNRDLPTPFKSRTYFSLRKEAPKQAEEEKKDDVEKKIDDKKDEKKDDKKDEKKKDDKKDDKKGDKKDGKAEQKMGRLGDSRPTPVLARWERRDAPVAYAPGSPSRCKLSAWLLS